MKNEKGENPVGLNRMYQGHGRSLEVGRTCSSIRFAGIGTDRSRSKQVRTDEEPLKGSDSW